MATPASSLPPPPNGQTPDQQSPTTPAAASPSPPQPSPAMDSGTQSAIFIIAKLRELAKAYPAAAPAISQINDLMRQVQAAMMQTQSPGEPQAPPTGG